MQQENVFKQFGCRQNLVIKRIIGDRAAPIVKGRQINIVLTPNLNTPGWTHRINEIPGINKYTHKIFLYVKDPGLVNVNDQESIKNITTKFRGTHVQVIEYFEAKDAVSATKGVPYMYKSMPLKKKKDIVVTLLTVLGEKLLQENIQVEYPDQSGDVNSETVERQDTDRLALQEVIEARHWDLLAKTLQYGKAKSNHVRVNIIGNQGAGKTTIVLRLHQTDVICPDKKQQPTEALDIREIASRCIEINGEKSWETTQNLKGYTEDLNLQRMAQAMKSVQRDFEEETTERKSWDGDEEDYDLLNRPRSYNGENAVLAAKDDYTSINKDESRVKYLKEILRKKDHSQDEKMYISYWDFAGQSTYYSTHQVFMSPSAVYVLVVDLSMDLQTKLPDNLNFRSGIVKDCSVKESLQFWTSSINAFTTDTKGGTAPVIIVGTHVDKVRKSAAKRNSNVEKEIKKKFDGVREIIKMSEVECVAVDNTDPDNTVLHNLRNRILELGLGVIDEEISAQWIDLAKRIQDKKLAGTMLMSFADLQRLDEKMDVPMKDKTRLEAFLGHQHNRGHLIYFLHDELKDLIILEPDILAKFLNILMRSRDQKDQRNMEQHRGMYNHSGIINYTYIKEAAKILSEGMHDNVDRLVNMLIHLSVIRPYKSDDNDTLYLLPCLLPHRPAESMKKTNTSDVDTKHFQIVFPNNHMPPTFFHVLLGGLLNEWKLVEKSPDEPEIYNLYARFRLETEAQQLEIFWESSRVYININNFSGRKSLDSSQIFGILGVVKKSIEEMFHVYRHTNTIYEIKVRCPKHPKQYVSLNALRKEGEAMCYGKSDHIVDCKEVFKRDLLPKKTRETLIKRLTDVDLGRLARYLVREDSSSLAARLRMYQGQVEADRAAQIHSDESHRRLHILFRWRVSNRSATIGDLLELLTVTKDYQADDLLRKLTSAPKRRSYDIPDSTLDCIPEYNVDLRKAPDSIGALYPFLMLELGLRFIDIQEAMANNPRDMWQIIFTLLDKWRKRNPKSSTPRVLLDTAKFVEIDTTEMQKGISDIKN